MHRWCSGAPLLLPPVGRQVLFQRLSGAPLFCSLPQPAQGGAGPPAQARLAAHPRTRPRCPLRAGRRRPLLGAGRGRPLGIGRGARSSQAGAPWAAAPARQGPRAPLGAGRQRPLRAEAAGARAGDEDGGTCYTIPQGYTCLL